MDVAADPPIEGAKEAIRLLRKKYKVVVFTTRAGSERGKEVVEEWLDRYGIEVDGVTASKLPAAVYIDDKAITFAGNWTETIEDTLNFLE